MIRVTLTNILVNDQSRARKFYTDILGFKIKHDIPMGAAAWASRSQPPDDPDRVELLLEPAGYPAAAPFQQALYKGGIPLT